MAAPTRFWKIRHKPTGLFYKPSKFGSRSNLSPVGKVYARRPAPGHIGGVTVRNPEGGSLYYGREAYMTLPGGRKDLEIVEYEVREVKSDPLI